MLTADEFADFDLSRLSAGLLTAAMRQDRVRRDAVRLRAASRDVPAPGFDVALVEIDDEAAALAEAARLVDRLRHRLDTPPPAAPVLHLVPRAIPDPIQPVARVGVMQRVRAAMRGRPALSRVA